MKIRRLYGIVPGLFLAAASIVRATSPGTDLNNFSATVRNYNLVCLGNAALNSSNDTQEGLAVEGNLTLNGNTLMSGGGSNFVSSGDPGLYVGGHLTLYNGFAKMNGAYACTPGVGAGFTFSSKRLTAPSSYGSGCLDSTNSNSTYAATSPVTNPAPAGWSWPTATSTLTTACSDLAGLATNGTISVNSQNLKFNPPGTLPANGVVVFSLDCNLLGMGSYNGQSFSNIQINVPANVNYVINVLHASGNTLFPCGTNFNSGTNNGQIIWNVPGSGTLSFDGGQFFGSILAPGVSLTTNNTIINGQVVAASFNNDNCELHFTTFQPTTAGSTPPVFTSPNNLQVLVVGHPYTFTATATNSPTFSAVSLPPAITMASTGVISGTPTTIGSYTATLTATNSSGSATQSLPFIVYPVPVINPPLSVTGKLNEPFTYTISATGSPTSYNATGMPAWLSVNTATGVLTGTPTATGTFTCTISASNPGATGSATLTITVSNTYTLTIAGSPVAGGTFTGAGVYDPGTVVSISETANATYRTNGWGGADGAATAAPASAATTITMSANRTLSAQFVPQGILTVTATAGGTVTGSGTFDIGANAPITATVTGGNRFTGWTGSGVAAPGANSTTVNVTGNQTVTGNFTPLTPPVFTSPNNLQILVVGQPYSFTATATNGPTFSAVGLPPAITMASGGVISGTPTTVGSYTATLTATNSSGSATQSLPFIVYPVPVINPPFSVTGKLNEPFTYTISATGSPTSYNATGMPAWLSVNTATGVISGTPTATGTFTCTMLASNPGATGSATLTITVSNTYTLAISPSIGAGGTYTGAGVYDPGTVVSISETANGGYRTNGWGGADSAATAAPASASTTITMSANRTLVAQYVQQAALTVMATAGGTSSGSGTFDMGANAPITASPSGGNRFTGWTGPGVAVPSVMSTMDNVAGTQTVTANFTPLTPPVFTSPNNLQILVVGQPYSFTATATYTPTFSAVGLPPGITMASTGVISGTPTTVGSYTATLTATNSSGSATQSLPFIVYPVPVINPPLSVTGKLNEPFTYTITATGSPTSYNATGMPAWLSVNTVTGVLTGTPTATGTFTCTVLASNPGATGSATLTITVSNTYTLTVSAAPAAGGTFTGAGVYDPGTVVSISETANAGYRTSGWGGADGAATAAPANAATTITMSANRTIAAQFVQQAVLTVTAGAGGTATGSGTFDVGANAPITATPSGGNRFTGWTGPGVAVPSSAATTDNIAGTQTITANFTPLTPPVFTSPNNLQILVVGQPYSFTATATYTPTFSAVGLPPGITMASTGVISGTPTTVGSYTATLTATNSSGSATQSLPFIVYPVPVINPPLSVTGKLNEPFTYTITATGSPTSYNATGMPAWLSVNTATGVLTGTPTATGTYTCTVLASNPGATGSATLTITVSQTYTLTMSASPGAGGTFTGTGIYDPGTVVSISETANAGYRTSGWGGADGAATASPSSASTTITMSANRTVAAQFVQSVVLTVNATAGGTATGSGTFDVGSSAPISATASTGNRFTGWTGPGVAVPTALSTTDTVAGTQTVTATFTPLTPPVFTSPNNLQILVVGQPYSFTATATYSPTFSAVGLPPGITMASTGVISGTPTTVGSYTATLTATNSSGSATQSLPFIVYPVPVINPPLSVTGKLNEPFTYTITATGSPTSYNATGMPAWLSVNTATGVLTGTPTATGTFTCTVLASNPGATGSATLTITVSQTYTLTMSASPGAGGTFTGTGIYDPGTVVSISETANAGYRTSGWGGADGAATASPSSASTTITMSANRTIAANFIQQAVLTVTATAGGTVTGGGIFDVGASAPITATVSTGNRFTGWTGPGVAVPTALSTTDTVAGTQTVTATFTPLTPPVFTSPNNLQILVVGQPYSFTATATYSPTFSAVGLPPGITMASTGVISGTPTTVGSYTATLTATNSSGSATQSLPFIVYPVPVINPPLSVTGKLNEPFTYTITATGSPTSYNATGMPAWLSVNTATGVLTGTPTATGTFTCTILASNPGATGSATLTITVSNTFTLTITGSPVAGGTFTGAGIYDPGTVVSISETANATYRTNGWGGTDGAATAAPASAATTITMSANRTLSAQFVPQGVLTVSATAGGTVTGSGTFDIGANAPITATASTGNRFTGWTGAGVAAPAANATTANVTGNQTVTGNFTPLTPPVFTSPNNLQILVVGQPYSFTATATYAPTFSAVGLPPGITMASTGVISGNLTTVGSYTATLTATNSSGSATQSLPFIVYPVPVINPPLSVTGKLNQPFTYTISATGSPTSYNATGLPAWLSVNTATGVISGTPTATGPFTCTVLASNPGATGSATLTITVSQTYTLTISPSAVSGGTYTGGGIYDPGTVVSISETANAGYRTNGWGGADSAATAAPASASTTITMSANRVLVAEYIQQADLTVAATTGGSATGSGTFDMGANAPIAATAATGNRFTGWTGPGVVAPSLNATMDAVTGTQTVTANFTPLTPPVFTSPNNLQILVVGQPYTFTATATYTPTFSAVGLPPGITMASTGVISGNPTTVGSYTATLTATNSSGSATQSLPFIVYPVPVINPPLSVTGKLNEPFTYTITATGSPTSFNATGMPAWLSVNTVTGVLTGTPTATGVFTCTVLASNPGATGSATLTITVSQTYTLTIAPSAVSGGTYTGAGIYDPGTVVSISETANAGYRTSGWGGADGAATAAPASAATTITMSANRALVAEYVQQAVLTVNAGAGGTATGSGTFDVGANAPIAATASTGNRFTGWTGPGVAAPSLNATMDAVTGTQTVTANFTPLTPPVFTSPNNLQVLVVGQPYTFTATATYTPTFSAVGLPPGITMASTGVISGNATTVGSYTATLTATNSSGSATQSLPFIVYPVPVINPPLSVTGKLNEPFTYTITATGSPTSYNATGMPAWLSVNTVTGVLTGTPTATGVFTCTVLASNPGATGSATLTITVSQTYTLTLSGSPVNGGTFTGAGIYDPGAVVSITETANTQFRGTGWGGPDGGATAAPASVATTITMSSDRNVVAQFAAQDTLTVNAGTGGTATGTGVFDHGTYAPIAATPSTGNRFTGWTGHTVTNAAAGSTTILMVEPSVLTANFTPLTPPVFTSPNNLQILVVGQPYTFTATATYTPTFSAVGLPPGITMASTGVISGTPTTVGTYTATLTATNSSGSATQSLPFIVYPVPVINPPLSVTGKLNEPFTYTITATGSPTSFNATSLPSWLTVDTSTGIISGTPTATGVFTCTVLASNPGATGTATLTITVTQTYTLAITGAPSAGGVFTGAGVYDPGTVVSIAETANSGYRTSGWGGADGAATAAPANASTTITMSANRTVVANFVQQGIVTVVAQAGGTATGSGTFDALSSAPITAAPNSGYRFTGWTNNGIANLVANQAAASTTVTVPASNVIVTAGFTVLTPPVFTSPNNLQILVVGQPYSFTATATYTPTFSAVGLPPGITMASSGVISGTPTTLGPYTATLTATNSSGSATQSLPFMVYPVPVINPPLAVTGRMNTPFTYTISATGSPTSYGAAGLPGWLTLDPVTGILSGTPPAAGVYTCTISASNPGATGSATLTITVSQTFTLAITGSPAAGGTFTGAGIYDPGATVSISETANGGYRTNGWGGNDGAATASPASASTTITMSANRTLTAQFVAQGALTVLAGPGGVASGSGNYDLGTTAAVAAFPNANYRFTGWTGSVANSAAASTTVTVNGNQTVTANFTLLTPPVFTSPNNLQILVVGQPYSFTATATYSPTFSAVSLPNGITMAPSGVISGTPTTQGSWTATLTATNSSGFATQSLPFIVYPVPVINPPLSVSGRKNVAFSYAITATGSPTSFGASGLPGWLTVDPVTGIMTGTPPASGIYTCTISASNPGATGSATLTITVGQTYTLSITSSPVAGGSFTGAGVYDVGTVVAITETANSGYRTAGWGGSGAPAVASSGNPSSTITMNGDYTLVANFVQQATLTVIAGSGGTATGSGVYDRGTSVAIGATATGANVFTGWAGPNIVNVNAANTTVTLTGDETVTAAFVNAPTPEQLGTIIFPNAVASGQAGITPTTSTMPAVFVNPGSSPETVTALTTTGDYQPTVTLPFTIGPGQSYSVTMTFAPAALGQRMGLLTAISNDPSNPVAQFVLQGLGVNPNQPPSANINAPPTAYTGSPLTVTSTAIAPMNNLTLHSVEWISASSGWTVNVANVSGGTSNRTVGVTFPATGVWTLRAGVSIDNGVTWYYSSSIQVTVSKGTADYTLQTMAIPTQSALPWYTPSPVVQQTYQVKHINP